MNGKRILTLFTAFAVTGFMTPHSASAEAVIGQKAPAFSLSDSEGNSRSLSEFSDSYVVLEWFNHECPFVRKHYGKGDMQKLQKEYSDKGVSWLSICSSAPGKQGFAEPAAAHAKKAEKKVNATAVLLDPTGEVGKLYGAKVTPHIFIINPKGVLIYQGAIDDIPSRNPEDIPKANNYVRATLNASMANQPLARTSSKPYGCSIKYAK